MINPKDVAVIELNIRDRTVTLYEIDEMSGRYSPLPPINMKYAKVSPFGHIVEAALKMALVKSDNESSY